MLIGIVLISLLNGCQQNDVQGNGNDDPAPAQASYTYEQPQNRGDGWETDSILNHGIDEAKLSTMMGKIEKKTYNAVDGIVIVKGGKLVFEAYFDGYDYNNNPVAYDWNIRHHNASVTKSIVSALIGIAIDKGFFDHVDHLIKTSFEEYPDLDWGDEKDQIRIRHLLNMTSGLYYDESSTHIGSEGNSHYEMNHSPDPIKFVLEQQMVSAPGEKWNYSSGNTVLLGRMIKRATGIYIDQFAENYLFNHLGISDYTWNDYETGDIRAHGGLALRPRDMAKFGQLFLNKGVWNGTQVISADWVEKSTANQIPISEGGDYGYSWWLYTFQVGTTSIPTYRGVGWGGQQLIVIPSLDTVVVITCGNWNNQDDSIQLFQNEILPSLLSK